MYYHLIVITIKCTVPVFIYKKIGYVTYTIFNKLFCGGVLNVPVSDLTSRTFYLDDRFVKRHGGLPDSN